MKPILTSRAIYYRRIGWLMTIPPIVISAFLFSMFDVVAFWIGFFYLLISLFMIIPIIRGVEYEDLLINGAGI